MGAFSSIRKLGTSNVIKRNVSKTGQLGGKFKVVLDLQSPRNHIIFSPGGVSKNGKTSRLALATFERRKSWCWDISSFTMPDGQVMYFYESDRIQEAHLPPEQKPKVPENDSHFGTPIFPCPFFHTIIALVTRPG